MSEFKVGNQTVGESLITDEVKVQLQEEEALLQPVTEETFEGIELTDAQQQAVVQVKSAINLLDDNTVLTYGNDDASNVGPLTERALSHTRASELGDLGGALVDLATALEVGESDTKGFFGIFKKVKNKGKALQVRYESAQSNIERVVGILENNQVTLIKNQKDLDELLAANKETYQRLTVYVEAGKQKIQEVYDVELPALEEKAKSGKHEDALAVSEMRDAVNLFEKQVHDLDAQISLSQALAIQLKTLMNANRAMIQKIQRSKTTMIPSWQMYYAVAFYNQQTEKALEADKKVTDTYNDLLVKATSNLRDTAKRSAEQSERAIVDIETLEKMNAEVIGSLQDIQDAQDKGHKYRQEANAKLGLLRNDLTKQLQSTIASQKE